MAQGDQNDRGLVELSPEAGGDAENYLYQDVVV